jgi:molybdopterin molybdotransferase
VSAADWLGYEEALALVMASAAPVGRERVPAADALARSLAEPILARVDHPPWDNSAMDGFAVHADDVRGATRDAPVRLPISDEIAAGEFPSGPLEPGTAARIMTGAPVPESASGVIRVEHTDGGPGSAVAIYDDSDAGRHIRSRGEDVRAGDVLLEAGERITPAGIALLAMAGARDVPVGRRPRVGILVNGDELADAEDFDQVVSGRRIANSNGPGLAAQVVEAGGIPVPLGIARDDPESLRERILAASGCDAIVSAAGVSVGEHDHVKDVLDALGLERRFWRVKMRPGSATLFGTLDGRPFWGVPGNPVSALVTFEMLVRPGLRRMAGFREIRRAPIACRLAETLRAPGDVTSFLRVVLAGAATDPPEVRLTGAQGSGMLTSMRADGLAILPEGVSERGPGERADVVPLREWTVPPASG